MIPFDLAPRLADAAHRVCALSDYEHAALAADLRDLPDDATLDDAVAVWRAVVVDARKDVAVRALVALGDREAQDALMGYRVAARVNEADIADAWAHEINEHRRETPRQLRLGDDHA